MATELISECALYVGIAITIFGHVKTEISFFIYSVYMHIHVHVGLQYCMYVHVYTTLWVEVIGNLFPVFVYFALAGWPIGLFPETKWPINFLSKIDC